MNEHHFTEAPDRGPQKLISPDRVEVDILPFGGVNDSDEISWPDTNEVMSVVGFWDANNHLVTIVYEDLILKLISIEMFTVLKLVSWNDRKERAKDLKDIIYVVNNYLDIYSHKNEVSEMISEAYLDKNHMAIALLAENIQQQLKSSTLEKILEIVKDGMTDNQT